jgi:hypothetical protein
MHFHFSSQNLLLVGVFAHLLLSASKLVFKSPRQQAQIDTIEGKVDTAITVAQQVVPAVQAAVKSVAFKSVSVPFPPPPDLSLGLSALKDNALSAQAQNSSAQGGAS